MSEQDRPRRVTEDVEAFLAAAIKEADELRRRNSNMSDQRQRCETCRFRHGVSCRRYPPSLILGGDGALVEVWPMPGDDDWCGEWQAKYPTKMIAVRDGESIEDALLRMKTAEPLESE